MLLKDYIKTAFVKPLFLVVVMRIRQLAKEAEGQRSSDTIRDWLDLADILESEINEACVITPTE